MTKSPWAASKWSVRREESCNRVVTHPAIAGDKRVPSPADRGEGHGRCEDLGCAAPETRRRNGSGTITQPIVEQERSVSTPATRARRVPPLGAPVTTKPISVAGEMVE